MSMEQFKILLIESNGNQPCYEVLSRHWEEEVLTVANNENEALIALLYTRFHLVLLDAFLANEHIIGFVKSTGGLNSSTPIIVLLDGQDSPLKLRFAALEVDECWPKPLNVDALEQYVRQKTRADSLPKDYVLILLEKAQHNKALVVTIFKKLFAELPRQILEIKTALQNNQYQYALEITHKLHGSVSFCGFEEMQQHAYELENTLLRKDYQKVPEKFAPLKKAILEFVAKESVILDDIRL